MSKKRKRSGYDELQEQSLQDKKADPLFAVRKYNNGVKNELIDGVASKSCCVLDLACGKGGDFFKWRKYTYDYVGYDVCEKAIHDAKKRYGGRGSFHVQDCRNPRQITHLRFHYISCQFALHYLVSNDSELEQWMRDVSDMLLPGGFLLLSVVDSNAVKKRLTTKKYKGSLFKMTKKDSHKDYETINFCLSNRVCDDESVVPIESIRSAAQKADLLSVHDYGFLDGITPDDDLIGMYRALCFGKRKRPEKKAIAKKNNKLTTTTKDVVVEKEGQDSTRRRSSGKAKTQVVVDEK